MGCRFMPRLNLLRSSSVPEPIILDEATKGDTKNGHVG